MNVVKLTDRQIDNILAGRRDMVEIRDEIAKAIKAGCTIDNTLVQSCDYCYAKLEGLYNEYVVPTNPQRKPREGERKIINDKR